MKLVGDVKCELEDQSKRLEFLGELEDLMMRYQVSTVNVAWAFGTNWKLAQEQDEHGLSDMEIEDIQEKVVPRNVAISPSPEIPPKSGGFRKAGVSTPAGVDVGETTQDKVTVLADVVDKMDAEEAETRGELNPDTAPAE